MDLKEIFRKFNSDKGSKQKNQTSMFRFDWLVYGVVILVLVLDFYVLQGGVRKIFEARTEEVGARQIQSTRVNFEGYNEALKRIHGAEVYAPKSSISKNPFLVVD